MNLKKMAYSKNLAQAYPQHLMSESSFSYQGL